MVGSTVVDTAVVCSDVVTGSVVAVVGDLVVAVFVVGAVVAGFSIVGSRVVFGEAVVAGFAESTAFVVDVVNFPVVVERAAVVTVVRAAADTDGVVAGKAVIVGSVVVGTEAVVGKAVVTASVVGAAVNAVVGATVQLGGKYPSLHEHSLLLLHTPFPEQIWRFSPTGQGFTIVLRCMHC